MWISSTSAIWSPTVMTGFEAVIGSWKIMAMRVPRKLAQARGRGLQHVLALEQHLAGGGPQLARQQPHRRTGR